MRAALVLDDDAGRVLDVDRVAEHAGVAVVAVVSLVVETGRLLGVDVVGEGVETAEQADALGASGCDRLQGYYFGAPGPAAQLTGLLHALRT